MVKKKILQRSFMIVFTVLFFTSAGFAADKKAGSTPKFVPNVPEDTTTVTFTKTDIPGTQGVADISSDILDIDQEAHMVYAADRTTAGVDVFDVSGPVAKFVRTVKTSSAPNGLIVAKNINKLVAGLNDGNVAFIDLTTSQITNVHSGGKNRADEVDYDPNDKLILVAHSDEGFAALIDASAMKVVHTFANLGASLEQPRYNPADGLFYLSGAGTDTLFQFNPVKLTVNKIALPPGSGPTGIWINPKTNIGVIATRPIMTIWDFGTQKAIGKLDQTGRADQVFYDAKMDVFLFGETKWDHGPHVGIAGGTPIKFITNVPVFDISGNHNNAVLDETNKMVYFVGKDGFYGFPLPAKALSAAAAKH
jgi:hypothetical protein